MAKYFNLNSQEEDRNLLNLVRMTDLSLVAIEKEDIDKLYGGQENIINWDSMNNLLDIDTEYYLIKRKNNNSIQIISKEDGCGVIVALRPSELHIKASSKNSEFAKKYGFLSLFINNEEFMVFNDFRPNISEEFKLKKSSLHLNLDRIYFKQDDLYLLMSLDIFENEESVLGDKHILVELILNLQNENIINIKSTSSVRILDDFDFELISFKN